MTCDCHLTVITAPPDRHLFAMEPLACVRTLTAALLATTMFCIPTTAHAQAMSAEELPRCAPNWLPQGQGPDARRPPRCRDRAGRRSIGHGDRSDASACSGNGRDSPGRNPAPTLRGRARPRSRPPTAGASPRGRIQLDLASTTRRRGSPTRMAAWRPNSAASIWASTARSRAESATASRPMLRTARSN